MSSFFVHIMHFFDILSFNEVAAFVLYTANQVETPNSNDKHLIFQHRY